MPKELAHFKNFAKLKDTQVAFNDITVIAGKPGTGKSYVMKFMYAIDNARVSYIMELNTLRPLAAKLQKIAKELDDLSEEDNSYNEKNRIYELEREHLNKLILSMKNTQSNNETIVSLNNLLKSIFTDIDQISNNFEIEYKIDKIFYANNQLLGKLNSNNSTDNFIFVETPLILEFKKFMKREKGKTPYHIESLLNILDTDYSFTDTEQDKFIKEFTEKSKEIIKGDIESSGDSFIFNKEDEKNYDIVNASSGTKSIGLLQYLVTNKALKKGSVLYWEEPEVHLHPEWQLRMIDLFVELMNAGVKIVFSTHSPYMPDYLNAISKRRGFEDRVSFNLFKETEGVVENHILNTDEKWQMIQDELLGSLEEIMWEYI